MESASKLAHPHTAVDEEDRSTSPDKESVARAAAAETCHFEQRLPFKPPPRAVESIGVTQGTLTAARL